MTHSAEDPFWANDRGQKLLVPKAILECADNGVRVEEGRKKLLEGGVGRGFDCDKNQVGRADFFRSTACRYLGQVEISFGASDLQSTGLQVYKVPSCEESNWDSDTAQFSPIISA